MPRLLFALLALVFSAVTPLVRAELRPSELAIIAARGSQGSQDLARYYAGARSVPLKNICVVDLPAGETLPRDVWTTAVRPAIGAWLREHDPQRKLRCLVTVRD